MNRQTINRRTLLKRLSQAAACGAAVGAARQLGSAAMNRAGAEATIDVLLNEPIGTIRPGVYGQFAEHIGGVIYDGI